MTKGERKLKRIVFRGIGRSHLLEIRDARDLEDVLDLDESSWAATGADIVAIRCDPDFLRYLDTDCNGRVLCHEVKAAIRWLLSCLSDTSGIGTGRDSVALSALRTGEDPGALIHATACAVLEDLGRGAEQSIDLATVREMEKRIETTPIGAGGIILPQAPEDQDLERFLRDIIQATGGTQHPGAETGVGLECLEAFMGAAAAHVQWHERAHAGAATDRSILILGEDTSEAHQAWRSVRDKVDEYFRLCRIEAVRRNIGGPAVQEVSSPEQLELLQAAPLGPVVADGDLDFDGFLNPHYRSALDAARDLALEPVLGRPVRKLTYSDWRQVCDAFGPFEKWRAAMQGEAVAELGVQRLREYLDPRYRAAVIGLIQESSSKAIRLEHIRKVEKLILYQRWMIEIANNFVTFSRLFDLRERALFEQGSLVMDGRRLLLALPVPKRADHITIAGAGNMCVVYVEVAGGPGSSYEVAVPVTAGLRGSIFVGKQVLFQDLEGTERPGRVVHVIENPISLREAFVLPIRRLGALITQRVDILGKESGQVLDQSVLQAGGAAAQPTPVASGTAAGGGLSGVLGGGIAVAALGSALAFITKTLSGVRWYTILSVVFGALLAFIIPAFVLSVIKLRKRDLGALLEASGWAVNARIRMSIRRGGFFVHRRFENLARLRRRRRR